MHSMSALEVWKLALVNFDVDALVQIEHVVELSINEYVKCILKISYLEIVFYSVVIYL